MSTKTIIKIDRSIAAQFFEHERWKAQQKQKRHSEVLDRLEILRKGQEVLLIALQTRTADTELAEAARAAMLVISETVAALDAFTPELHAPTRRT